MKNDALCVIVHLVQTSKLNDEGTMRIVFSSLLVFSLIFTGAVARAQDDEDEAMTFFKKGIDLFNSESYEEAAEAFRKAYELKPNWKLNYNIGQSEAAAKRLGLALQAFEAYLSQGGDDIPTERRDEVLKEVERLRKMVGAVEKGEMAPAAAAMELLFLLDGKPL